MSSAQIDRILLNKRIFLLVCVSDQSRQYRGDTTEFCFVEIWDAYSTYGFASVALPKQWHQSRLGSRRSLRVLLMHR